MEFGGFQKLTVLDYPEHVACIVFTKGCNFRCPFCHNAGLVEKYNEETHTEEEIISYLKKRQGILDGVCVSGGEPLMHPELEGFLAKVKELGFDVKLDTNGSYPERLKDFVKKGLIDYVAMDIKNKFARYAETAGVNVPINNIEESIDFLMRDGVDYEFRTTVAGELHTPADIEKIAERIAGAKRYFIQNFVDSGNVLGEGLSPVNDETISRMVSSAKKYVDQVQNR